MADEPADNRLTSDNRPFLWLVTYEMDPSFFHFGNAEQTRMEVADGVHGVALAFELVWKAAYASTDLKRGWILLDMGNQSDQAEVEKIMQGYPMYKYYTQSLKYTRVFSATQAGFDLKMIWDGFKEFLHDRL
jgi:hypothetical protein